MMSHFVVVPIQSGWQTKTKFFLWFEDMQKIYHWILEWGDLVVCISSNLDITLFFFKELDKTKYGQISVILLICEHQVVLEIKLYQREFLNCNVPNPAGTFSLYWTIYLDVVVKLRSWSQGPQAGFGHLKVTFE